MSDWLFDHGGWLLGGLLAVVAGLTIWAVTAGGPACPKGQQLVVTSWVPIISIGSNGVEYTTIVPLYGCAA